MLYKGFIKKHTLESFFAWIIFKIILDVAYFFVISPTFRYDNFLNNLNAIKLLESYLIFFIIFIAMPKDNTKLSHVLIWVLLLLSFIPLLTLFAFLDGPRTYVYAATGFWLIVFLLIRLPSFIVRPIKRQQSFLLRSLLFALISTVVFFLIFAYFGFTFNFNLNNIYQVRNIFINMKIPLAGYLFTWSAYVINPLFFAIFFSKRKWIWMGLTIGLQLMLFSATGNRSFLFALPFVLFLITVVRLKNPKTFLAIGFAFMVFVGMLTNLLFGDVWASSLFTRRTLLVPAQVSLYYYDFFSNNDHLLLSNTYPFRLFVQYPYDLFPPKLIGRDYFGNIETNANTGLYGDAFMNFGYFGFLMWAVLLATLLYLVDIFSMGKDKKICIAAFSMASITLTNSAFFTSLLTNGILFSLLFIYLLPQINHGKQT